MQGCKRVSNGSEKISFENINVYTFKKILWTQHLFQYKNNVYTITIKHRKLPKI